MIHRATLLRLGLASSAACALAAGALAQTSAPAPGQGAAAPTGWTPPPPAEFFFDDFEGDTSGWQQAGCTGHCSVQWYVSEDGQCNSVSRMLVFNNPDFLCLYGWVGESLSGSIVSPAFTLAGEPPFHVSMDAIVDNDISADVAAIYIQDDPFQPTRTDQVALLVDWAPFVQAYSFPIPDGAYWAGRTAYLRFTAGADENDGHESARGWYIDNLRVHEVAGITGGAQGGAGCLPALQLGDGVAPGGALTVRLPGSPGSPGAADFRPAERWSLVLGPRSRFAAAADCTPFAGVSAGSWRIPVQTDHRGLGWSVPVPARPELAGLALQVQAVGRSAGRVRATPVTPFTIAPHTD